MLTQKCLIRHCAMESILAERNFEFLVINSNFSLYKNNTNARTSLVEYGWLNDPNWYWRQGNIFSKHYPWGLLNVSKMRPNLKLNFRFK